MAGSELRALSADLSSAAAEIRGKASVVVRRSGLAIQNHAAANAPVDTGFHRSAIQMAQEGDLSVAVTAHAEYAIYLEVGTSRMPPQPVMNPALEAVTPSFVSAIEALGGEVLR